MCGAGLSTGKYLFLIYSDTLFYMWNLLKI